VKTTNVVVNFQMPGIHAWPGVTKTKYHKNQGYLQFVHRHIFKITAEKYVSHADRDIEIIDLQNQMYKFLHESWWDDELQLADFGQMSCEMIAEKLVDRFQLSKCTVLEDGENGATVSYESPFRIDVDLSKIEFEKIEKPQQINPNVKDFNIAFVCGYMRSGKSTVARGYYKELLARGKKVILLEVSDIVKQYVSATERKHLQGHPELLQPIVAEITKAARSYDFVVVSGVRQVEILKTFPLADMMWVQSPSITRYLRYERSSKDKTKDLVTFNELNQRDEELGLLQVKKYIFERE